MLIHYCIDSFILLGMEWMSTLGFNHIMKYNFINMSTVLSPWLKVEII